MHCREGNSAARRLFRSRLTSVKKSTPVCAVIVRFVRLNTGGQFSSLKLSVSQLFFVRYSELEEVRVECTEDCGEGSAAVAEGELGLDVELGHGLVLFGEIKERVVAEAVAAAWGDDDLTFKSAVTHGEDFAVAGGSEDAVVTGAALGEGNSDEEGEEIEV